MGGKRRLLLGKNNHLSGILDNEVQQSIGIEVSRHDARRALVGASGQRHDPAMLEGAISISKQQSELRLSVGYKIISNQIRLAIGIEVAHRKSEPVDAALYGDGDRLLERSIPVAEHDPE